MASETIANGIDIIQHKLDLNDYGLRNVKEDQKREAKQEVADYLSNQILREVSAGVSPVQGEGRFKRLETEYAIKDKGGNRLSNLELEGDLLNDFNIVNDESSFLNIGHKGEQVPKADGHNQLSGKAKSWAKQIGFPRRRYIPDDSQKFTGKIVGEIRKIIGEYQITPGETQVDITPTISSTVETQDEVTVTSDNLFDDDVLDSLLDDAIKQRQNGGL